MRPLLCLEDKQHCGAISASYLWTTPYKENVAYLHRACPLYRSEGFQALNKIEIRDGADRPPVIAVPKVAPNSSGDGQGSSCVRH
jgi:hypothetical protein